MFAVYTHYGHQMLLSEEAVARIREQAGDKKVLLGLSGGVDSICYRFTIPKGYWQNS